jgi:UDP-N-acetyl-D-glucosamine 4,6-dehydratase
MAKIIKELFRPTFKKRVLFFILVDAILSIFTLYGAYLLRFNFHIQTKYFHNFWDMVLLFTSVKFIFLTIFSQYTIVWRFYSLKDAKRLFFALVLSYLSITILYLSFKEWFLPFPRSVIVIDFFLSLVFLLGIRLLKRLFLRSALPNEIEFKPTLIFGLSDYSTIKAILESDISLFPVGIIILQEENKGFIGGHIDNIKIYSKDDLQDLIKKYSIKSAIITKKLSSKELSSLIDKLKRLGVKEIKKAKILEDKTEKLENIQIEELLAREPKDLDTKAISEFINQKKVLVTGGGGSIGSQIVRELFYFNAKEIIIVENSEFNLYKISQELENLGAKFVPILENVCEKEAMEEIFKKYKIDIVIHSAAYKHVPLCEFNPKSAIKNNILGAMNIFELSIKYKVKKIVNISSDKAVRPTNVMGATKRVIELLAQNIPSKESEIVSVRFGNVLGSSGSVVPKFKEQIKNGGPVTVTHPDITRYFMLIDEACKLVLQAGALAKGKELFILDMGEPVKIVDLAKRMIELYAKDEKIEIVFTGLRPGEKLYEELLIDDAECKTKYESIYIAKASFYDFEQLKKDIHKLLNSDNPKEILKKILPEYNPKN